MTSFADKALRCVACGTEFAFTAREQEFHASKGFTNEPRRCPNCRQARRQSGSRDTAPIRPPREQPSKVGDSAPTAQRPAAAALQSDRRSYAATCSACQGEALLPFEPVGNRPVLCSACYDKIRTPA